MVVYLPSVSLLTYRTKDGRFDFIVFSSTSRHTFDFSSYNCCEMVFVSLVVFTMDVSLLLLSVCLDVERRLSGPGCVGLDDVDGVCGCFVGASTFFSLIVDSLTTRHVFVVSSNAFDVNVVEVSVIFFESNRSLRRVLVTVFVDEMSTFELIE